MRRFSFLVLVLALGALMSFCTPEPMAGTPEDVSQEQVNNENSSEEISNPQEQTMTIKITVGGKDFKAAIEETETGKAFYAKLPLTLDMSELNGNEKYCYGVSLPKADKYFASIAAGDLMLYSGNCIVLFYGAAGGYSYTRIGKLTSTEGLKEALGTGGVKVSFTKE